MSPVRVRTDHTVIPQEIEIIGEFELQNLSQLCREHGQLS